MQTLKVFGKDNSGAVNVDTIGLIGAAVGLGIAVLAGISGGVENLANDLSSQTQSIGSIAQATAGEWFDSFASTGGGGEQDVGGSDDSDVVDPGDDGEEGESDKKDKKDKKDKD